jgi:hypothetical protein
VWLLGVWQTGDARRAISLRIPELQAEHRQLLADFTRETSSGRPSPFATTSCTATSAGPPRSSGCASGSATAACV